MKKTILIMASIWIAISANAKPTNEISDKTLDSIIEKLETSGKLEVVLEKVMNKKIKEEKEKQAHAALEQEKKNQENAQLIAGFSIEDHYIGDKFARYSIIAYEDMECPYCRLYADVPMNVIKNFTHVNFVSRPNPLQIHMPAAAKEAVLAECIAEQLGNKGYFDFRHEIFKATLTNGQGLPNVSKDFKINANSSEIIMFDNFKNMDKSLFAVAKEIGIKDLNQTLTCYRDIKTSTKLQSMIQDLEKHGITGTPTTILKDNQTGKGAMITGIMTEEELTEKVQDFIDNK